MFVNLPRRFAPRPLWFCFWYLMHRKHNDAESDLCFINPPESYQIFDSFFDFLSSTYTYTYGSILFLEPNFHNFKKWILKNWKSDDFSTINGIFQKVRKPWSAIKTVYFYTFVIISKSVWQNLSVSLGLFKEKLSKICFGFQPFLEISTPAPMQ